MITKCAIFSPKFWFGVIMTQALYTNKNYFFLHHSKTYLIPYATKQSKIVTIFTLQYLPLTFACWVILHAFSSSVEFFKLQIFKNSFSDKQFGSRTRDQHICWPNPAPNCLQKVMIKVVFSRQRFYHSITY